MLQRLTKSSLRFAAAEVSASTDGGAAPSNDRMKRTAPASWSAAAYPSGRQTQRRPGRPTELTSGAMDEPDELADENATTHGLDELTNDGLDDEPGRLMPLKDDRPRSRRLRNDGFAESGVGFTEESRRATGRAVERRVAADGACEVGAPPLNAVFD